MGLYSVTRKLAGLKRYQRLMIKDLENGTGEFKTAFSNMARGYRRFLRVRYRRFSAGGGNWRPNKKGTPILRDTDTIYNALTPKFLGLPGQYERHIKGGVEIGIKGGKHPKAVVSVGQLSAYHQSGVGRNPRRIIIVNPPPLVKKELKLELVKAEQRVNKKTRVIK